MGSVLNGTQAYVKSVINITNPQFFIIGLIISLVCLILIGFKLIWSKSDQERSIAMHNSIFTVVGLVALALVPAILSLILTSIF